MLAKMYPILPLEILGNLISQYQCNYLHYIHDSVNYCKSNTSFYNVSRGQGPQFYPGNFHSIKPRKKNLCLFVIQIYTVNGIWANISILFSKLSLQNFLS